MLKKKTNLHTYLKEILLKNFIMELKKRYKSENEWILERKKWAKLNIKSHAQEGLKWKRYF